MRSDPSRPNTRPCTWNSGRPCTRVSSGVHCHACRQRVDIGGDGAPAEQHALGRAGGAGGVDDQRGGVRRRLRVAVPRAGVQPHRDVRQTFGLVGLLPQPRLRARVGEDVPAFGGADVGGHRDDGHPGDQAAGDRQHRRRGRGGQHGHPPRAADPFGHRRRGTDQVAAAQHGAVDAHRVADIGSGGDGRGVQRGQQHASEATRRISTRYWASGSHPACRVPRGVPERLDDGARGRDPPTRRHRPASTASWTSRPTRW